MLSKTDVHYEVVKKISVISQKGKNKTLELRYVAWNNAYPKYDIRVWSRNDDGSEMCGKGITLTDEEFYELGVIIDQVKNKDVEQYCEQNKKFFRNEKDFQQWKKTKLAGVVLPSPKQALIDRFTESSKRNRNLNEMPQRIALAAHLAHVKQVPNMRIAECGLMSVSKLHGLKHWQTQHLLDYCALNNVLDIYQNGMAAADIKNLLPDGGYDKLMAYIEKPNQNHQNESQDQLKSERDKLKDQLKDQLKKLYKYK